MKVQTIGLDIAKSVFQVHGVNAQGEIVMRERLARSKVIGFFRKLDPCLIGIEACSSGHYWGRELTRLGHQVKLIPAHYVKPYVKRSKTDAGDAEAICEAVTRPTMRFVLIKTREIEALNLLHTARSQLVSQRTAMINCLRSGLAEFGIVVPVGMAGAASLLERVATNHARVPKPSRGQLNTCWGTARHPTLQRISPWPTKRPAGIDRLFLRRAVSNRDEQLRFDVL